jgi:hypothetical protein
MKRNEIDVNDTPGKRKEKKEKKKKSIVVMYEAVDYLGSGANAVDISLVNVSAKAEANKCKKELSLIMEESERKDEKRYRVRCSPTVPTPFPTSIQTDNEFSDGKSLKSAECITKSKFQPKHEPLRIPQLRSIPPTTQARTPPIGPVCRTTRATAQASIPRDITSQAPPIGPVCVTQTELWPVQSPRCIKQTELEALQSAQFFA